MYSTYNEGKMVFAERFIRTLTNNIYKHTTAVSKNVYFNVLNDIVNEYNNTYHRTKKMKPIDVKSDSFVGYNEGTNEKGAKFEIRYHVRISKYKNIFVKGVKFFVIQKVKNTVPWTYYINDLNGEEVVGRFHEKVLQKQIKNKLE